ncbi:MAG: GC-type dockerin domain-anchored protein [Planctomycetota bacterium]
MRLVCAVVLVHATGLCLADPIDGEMTVPDTTADTGEVDGDIEAPRDCNPSDLAEPFGWLDLSDIDAFIVGFVAQDPIADIAAPAGIFDLSDIDVFIRSFVFGCP